MSQFKKRIATVLIAAMTAFGVTACDPIENDLPPTPTETTDPVGS